MKAETRALQRDQIDRQLAPFRRKALAGRPSRGWVRAVREALGMNGSQLARRMGIARSHLSQIEDAESRETVSLRTLRRAADALGCDLVYAIVPRNGRTLEELLHDRAEQVASSTVENAAGNMALEGQPVGDRFKKRETDRIAAYLVQTLPRSLWNEWT